MQHLFLTEESIINKIQDLIRDAQMPSFPWKSMLLVPGKKMPTLTCPGIAISSQESTAAGGADLKDWF